MIKTILFFTFLFLLACHQSAVLNQTSRPVLDMTGQDDNLVVPASLWKTFEAAYPELTEIAPSNDEKKDNGAKKEEPKSLPKGVKTNDNDAMFKRRPTVDPFPLSVFLSEKTPGVLGGQNYELKFASGGGFFDYKDLLPETKNGTFYLKVKYDSVMDALPAKIFYLSNTPENTLAKSAHDKTLERFGSGCNKYYEITKYWQKIMSGEGLALNTVGLRHLSMTTGTFFFVSPVKGKLRLAHLTIKDSRHKNLLCQAGSI